MKTRMIKEVYTIESWNDDLIIDGELFTYDPRLIEHRDALGHASMNRLVMELIKSNGKPLKYVRVYCKDCKPNKIYIFSN